MKIDAQKLHFEEVILRKPHRLGFPNADSRLIAKNVTINIPSFQIDSVGNEEEDDDIAWAVYMCLHNYLARKAALDQIYEKSESYTKTLGERDSWLYFDDNLVNDKNS